MQLYSETYVRALVQLYLETCIWQLRQSYSESNVQGVYSEKYIRKLLHSETNTIVFGNWSPELMIEHLSNQLNPMSLWIRMCSTFMGQIIWGFHGHGGTPIAGSFIREIPYLFIIHCPSLSHIIPLYYPYVSGKPQITIWKITIFHGYINYFHGHFLYLPVSLPWFS